MRVYYSVNVSVGNPGGRPEHLDGPYAGPLEINKARDVPVRVDEDVTLVEVSQGGDERAVTKISVCEFGEEGSHGCQSCELVLAVSLVVDGVGLVSETVILACNKVKEVWFDRGVGQIPRYVGWDLIVFELVEEESQGAVGQGEDPAVVYRP